MNPLLLPYIFNIFILVPVGLGTLLDFFPAAGAHFPESAGWRTLVGSLWTALLVGSVCGLFHPLAFSAVLLLQIIYKSLWLAVYVAPRLADPTRRAEIPWGIAGTFLVIVALYPWLVPWRHLFGP